MYVIYGLLIIIYCRMVLFNNSTKANYTAFYLKNACHNVCTFVFEQE